MSQVFTREEVIEIIDKLVEFITYNQNPDITGEDFMDMFHPENDDEK